MIRLVDLTPAAEEGWWLLFDLAEIDDSWLLVGGQMMQLLAVEHGLVEQVRPTDDVDVVVNVRLRRGGTEWLAGWLRERDFQLEGVSTDGVGHRFTRRSATGHGTTVVDVLAPEGIGERANVYTVRPARTVQVPGSVQAFERSELVEVTVSGVAGRGERSGIVRRPNLLGALVAKAAATAIAVRENRARDWQDAALLLAAVADPIADALLCRKKDRDRLALLEPLNDRGHIGWATLGDDEFRRGTAALGFLLGG